MSVSIRQVRELNRLYPQSAGNRTVRCHSCGNTYTADLARYFSVHDPQVFGCPTCDHTDMTLTFDQCSAVKYPLAQRFA